MGKKKVYTAIGLMSGTSLDGIDAALIETDGYEYARPLDFACFPYARGLRDRIRACFGRRARDAAVTEVESLITKTHIDALRRTGWRADIIGFHGQTILHDPKRKITLQLGRGDVLAQAMGRPVIGDFRSADVAAGGQGAPFLPLYHRARVREKSLPGPVAVLNIGGVANATWVGTGENDILAFDTGPGNALIDDFMRKRTGAAYDEGGNLAALGVADQRIVKKALARDFFAMRPPKSLDRNAWGEVVEKVEGLSDADGAATLTEFTVQAVKAGERLFERAPGEWLVAGGRAAYFMMQRLRSVLGGRVRPVEDVGWNGDALEAEGFGYLAVRSLLGEPLSLPRTTGVPAPQRGGVLFRPE